MDTLPELSSTKSDTSVTSTTGQSALDSKASDDLKLTKQITTSSESPTLVAKDKVKQDSDSEQEPKGSVISRFGKRVLDGYNKKASKSTETSPKMEIPSFMPSSLPPVFYHFFRTPLPYARTLSLQEQLHAIQLSQRRLGAHKDVLLLLEHRPVYTAGRRQNEDSIRDDKLRLTNIGADFINTQRGGELTYHGPGQIVGYPLLDLSRYSPAMGIRDYICRMQKILELHLSEGHGITPSASEHTGVFLNPTTKIASIGVQVRHRLTTHGFSMNITSEPITWFNQIVACGLADVKAGSIEGVQGRPVSLKDEIPALVERFGKLYEREMVEMDPKNEGEIGQAILETEEDARRSGSWATEPIEAPIA